MVAGEIGLCPGGRKELLAEKQLGHVLIFTRCRLLLGEGLAKGTGGLGHV